jgi:hypothetical protein
MATWMSLNETHHLVGISLIDVKASYASPFGVLDTNLWPHFAGRWRAAPSGPARRSRINTHLDRSSMKGDHGQVIEDLGVGAGDVAVAAIDTPRHRELIIRSTRLRVVNASVILSGGMSGLSHGAPYRRTTASPST